MGLTAGQSGRAPWAGPTRKAARRRRRPCGSGCWKRNLGSWAGGSRRVAELLGLAGLPSRGRPRLAEPARLGRPRPAGLRGGTAGALPESRGRFARRRGPDGEAGAGGGVGVGGGVTQ